MEYVTCHECTSSLPITQLTCFFFDIFFFFLIELHPLIIYFILFVMLYIIIHSLKTIDFYFRVTKWQNLSGKHPFFLFIMFFWLFFDVTRIDTGSIDVNWFIYIRCISLTGFTHFATIDNIAKQLLWTTWGQS